jgi:DnaJ-class molecular chaperone
MNDLNKYLLDLGFNLGDRPTTNEMKSRWKELCRKHHPDIGGSTEEFNKVTHAYKMLTDTSYRYSRQIEEMKHGKANAKGDLNITITYHITFEEDLFGRMCMISFNQLSFTPNFEPIEQKVIPITTIPVMLPAGYILQANTPIHFEGKGHICGDSVGDLRVMFTVKPHKKFTIDGENIKSVEQIPLISFIKGDKLEVETAFGLRPIKVKAGSTPGDIIKIDRCGVLGYGYHIVQLQCVFPSKQNLKEGEWKGLNIDWAEEEEAEDKEAT